MTAFVRTRGYRAGDPLMVCGHCGKTFHRSEGRFQWDNVWACHAHWDRRHPGLTQRSVYDHETVRNARPLPSDTFVDGNGFHLLAPGLPWNVGFRLVAPNGGRKLNAAPDG